MINVILRLFLVGSILLIIQIGTAPLIAIKGSHPDLLLVFSIMVTYSRGRYAGLAAGFLSGLAQDTLTVGFIGVFALAKSTTAFWFGTWLEYRETSPKIAGWIILIVICSLGHDIVSGFFFLQGTELKFGNYLLDVIIPSTLYTSLLGLLWILVPIKHGKQNLYENQAVVKRKIKP